MTIYILDNDPQKCAEMLDDRSLDRMIRDIVQVLYNVHYICCPINLALGIENKNIPFKHNFKINQNNDYITDKWSQWSSECIANYKYLVELGIKLCREFHHRNGEKCDKEIVDNGDDHCGAWHKMRDAIDWARDNVPDLPRNLVGLSLEEDSDHSEGLITPFPLVMPKKFNIPLNEHFSHFKDGSLSRNYLEEKIPESYRNYYQSKIKKHLWTKRRKPEWLKM